MRYLTLALAAVIGLVSTKATAQIYDTVSPAVPLNFFAGAGNNVSGDNFLPPAGPWTAQTLRFIVAAQAPGIYPVTINFYNGVNPAAPPILPAFVGLPIFTITGNITIGGPPPPPATAFLVTVNGLNFPLPAPAAGGLAIEFIFGGAPNLSSTYKDAATAALGSVSSNGFFIDVGNNGTLQNNEFVNFAGWTNGNLVFALDGTSPMSSASRLGPMPSNGQVEFHVEALTGTTLKPSTSWSKGSNPFNLKTK